MTKVFKNSTSKDIKETWGRGIGIIRHSILGRTRILGHLQVSLNFTFAKNCLGAPSKKCTFTELAKLPDDLMGRLANFRGVCIYSFRRKWNCNSVNVNFSETWKWPTKRYQLKRTLWPRWWSSGWHGCKVTGRSRVLLVPQKGFSFT